GQHRRDRLLLDRRRRLVPDLGDGLQDGLGKTQPGEARRILSLFVHGPPPDRILDEGARIPPRPGPLCLLQLSKNRAWQSRFASPDWQLTPKEPLTASNHDGTMLRIRSIRGGFSASVRRSSRCRIENAEGHRSIGASPQLRWASEGSVGRRRIGGPPKLR